MVAAKEGTAARTTSTVADVDVVARRHVHVATPIGVAVVAGSATTITASRHLKMMIARFAKCASSAGTRRTGAGTDLMKIMCQIRSLSLLQ